MLPQFGRIFARLVCLWTALFALANRGAEAPPAVWATFLTGSIQGMLTPKVLANPAGGFYLFSTGDRPLIKFNADGTVAWEVRYEIGVNDIRDCVQLDILDNGDLIAVVSAGANARVFGQQFSKNGRWLVRLRGADASPLFVKPVENFEITALGAKVGGGFFVAGYTIASAPALIGTDELAVATNKVFVAQFTTGLDWITTGEWKGFGSSIDAIRNRGAEIWAAGNSTDAWTFGGKSINAGGAFVVRVGPDGSVVDGRVVAETNGFAAMELRPGGGANLATVSEVIRLNADASVAWRKPISAIISAVSASDEAYVSGWNGGAGYTVAFDAAGNEKWRRVESSRSVNTAMSAALLSDGRLAVSGTAEQEGMFINDFFLSNLSAIDLTYYGAWVAIFDVRATAPPVFAEQPRDQKFALRGETVELRANVYSPTAQTFQWFKDGAKWIGQTSSNLVLANVQGAQAGKYFVEAANAAGTTRSREVTVVVNTVSVGTVAGTDAAGAFEEPRGVVTSMDGSIIVADSARHIIKRVTPSGITTFAGTGVSGLMNGAAVEAQFSSPTALATDWRHQGPWVYVADRGNGRLRRILFSSVSGDAVSVESLDQFPDVSAVAASDGIRATVLGSEASGIIWEVGYGARILPASAGFGRTGGLAMDERRNVFVSDLALSEIRRMAPGGDLKTIASQLNQPRGMVLDDGGNIYVVESGAHRITKVSPNGIKTLVAGRGVGGFQNGSGAEATFNSPDGICFREGALIAADTANHCLREIRFAPMNAAADPRIQIEFANALLISVSGSAGTTFVIESADNISPGTQWQFEGNVVAESAQKFSLTAPGSTRFYRARRSP
jgi:hypothetical protein